MTVVDRMPCGQDDPAGQARGLRQSGDPRRVRTRHRGRHAKRDARRCTVGHRRRLGTGPGCDAAADQRLQFLDHKPVLQRDSGCGGDLGW